MSDNECERLDKIEKNQLDMHATLTEIKLAICGSEKIGVEGIIAKVKRHEAILESNKKTQWMILGGATVISSILAAFWDHIFSSK